MMKLIFAIINKDDSNAVQSALTQEGYSVTKLATQGGFLMAGNLTFIIGTQADKVPKALELIKENSKKRKEQIPASATFGGMGLASAQTIEVTVGGATIFVVDVDQFEKF